MSTLSGGSEWALLLAPEPPYPITGGGAMRTASLLHFLASRYRVHVVTFTVGDGPDPEAPLPANTAEQCDWIHLPHHRKTLAARVARNTLRLCRGVLPLSDRFSDRRSRRQVAQAIAGRRYALAVLEHFWCAAFLEMLRPRADFLVIDMANVESALHAHCARTEQWPARWAHRAFARIATQAEKDLLPQFDLVLATSQADQQKIRELAPRARVAVYANAIPLRFTDSIAEEHCVAFSGNLEYHPNVAAVRFFARRVWPELRERDPHLRWRLIGRNEWAVRDEINGDPRIETTGAVEDPLRELARARLVVVPVLAGSGTRVKILEAWAAGRAVVSTRLGAEGLPARDGDNLLLADTPDEILQAVLALLRDDNLRHRLGQAGRRIIERDLCWPAVWDKLEQTLTDLGFQSSIVNPPIVNSATIGESS